MPEQDFYVSIADSTTILARYCWHYNLSATWTVSQGVLSGVDGLQNNELTASMKAM
jgi:hypothetical protein